MQEEGKAPWSGTEPASTLCGFEGAKGSVAEPQVRSESGVETQSGSEARTAKRSEPEQPYISGDNSLRDPPVPIPNTEVKPQHADSTWLETAR